MTITPVTNPECGYLKKFEHQQYLYSSGIRSAYITWCDTYCEGLWGWFFVTDPHVNFYKGVGAEDLLEDDSIKAYMSFERYDDLIKFKLSCLSS